MSEHQTIQDLSFEQYREASGVSASMLKVLRQRSPMHLRYAMQHPEPPTDAQRFGALVHSAILTPDLSRYHVKPEGLDFRTKDGKAWRDERQDLPIVTHDEHASIVAMRDAVHAHPIAKLLLNSGEPERSVFVRDSQGTMRKLRPDIIPNSGNILPDLKTCESAHPDMFAKAIANYEYFAQAGYYLEGMELAGRSFEVFAFIAVEKSPPYACAVYTLDSYAAEFGRKMCSRDLMVYRQCEAENRWPAYGNEPTPIALPPYMQKVAEQFA